MPSVNGKTYDNLKLRMMGLRVNAEKFDHSYGRDAPTALYDGAGNIVGKGRGQKKLVDVSIDFTVENAQTLEDIAFVPGKRPDDFWEFPITVEYWNNVKSGNFLAMKADAIHTRTLVNCSIDEVSASFSRGDGKLVKTFKITATDIV